MKLLVQGDDFGYTKAVTYGIVDAIDNGVLNCTGLFVNMPATGLAVSFMKDRPQTCFGIDFNIMVGHCISDPKDIPHLVDEDGLFITNKERKKNADFFSKEGLQKLYPHDEMYHEMKAQYEKYLELTGGINPGYMNPHALMYEGYTQVIHELSLEYKVPFSMDVQKDYKFANVFSKKFEEMIQNKVPMPTYKNDDEKLIAQIHLDPWKDIQGYNEYLLQSEYATIGGHPGFVDAELVESSSLSLERMRDQQLLTSQKVKDWIKENHIELITYHEFSV
jgi:predicted glycoside hydrolase/deacetylase ChbG (UPF0249 family)